MTPKALRLSSLGYASFVYLAPQAFAKDVDWSGYYVGVSVGTGRSYGSSSLPGMDPGSSDLYFLNRTPRFSAAVPFAAVSNSGAFSSLQTFDVTRSRFAGGINAGRNWQWDQLVVGLELDGANLGGGEDERSWRTSDAFNGGSITGSGTRTLSAQFKGKVNQLFSLRTRIGYATDNLLIFGTGGIALGNVTLSSTAALDEQYADPGKGGTQHTATSRWSGRRTVRRGGLVAGGGFEYTFENRMSLKFEALHFKLAPVDIQAMGIGSYTNNGGASTAMSVQPYTIRQSIRGTILRVGLNWRL